MSLCVRKSLMRRKGAEWECFMNLALMFTGRRERFIPPLLSVSPLSKLAQDNRMESPIPILPLSTPDADTEKLIKMKDEEVRKSLDFLFKNEW